MKKTLKTMLLLWALIVGGVCSVWAGETGYITFGSGSGDLNINNSPVSGTDSQSNTWTVTTTGTTSFSPNKDYAQIGSAKNPATSITFTTTLPEAVNITLVKAELGGFSGTAGTVTLKVGDTTVGTGSLNAAEDVNVSSTLEEAGNVITVTITDIAKGVKAYKISYTYEAVSPASPLASIGLSGTYPTTFNQGDEFSHEGMTVTATYEDESTKDITAKAEFSGYDKDTTGDQTVTVSYTEGGVTKTAEYEITVNAPATLTSISLSGDYQTTFTEGDDFNHNGITVTATYSDNTTKDVTSDAEFSTPDMTQLGSQTITVTYDEQEISYDIIVNAIPSHNVTWSVNGTTTIESFKEGAAIAFPENPDDVSSKTFVGWGTEAITGTTDEAPTFITSATMDTEALTFYAVFADKIPGTQTTVTDVLTGELTGVTGNGTYSNWSGKTAKSDATYAGNSAVATASIVVNAGAIQMRTTNSNSGIISTTSGGTLKSVTVTWTGNQARTLDIYGSNTAYAAASDLYDSKKQGTKLGSIVKNTNTSLTVSGDYAYVGLRSNNGALYLDDISIEWTTGTPDTYSAYCTTVVAAAVERPQVTVAQNPFMISTTATITCETEGAAIMYSFDGENWNEYSEALTITETTTIYAKAIKDENVSDAVSVTATKNLAEPIVTIDATGINTDIYVGTDAGMLSASVTYNDAAVEGAVVTWSGNNDEVATIDPSTGAVTLVAEGTVTFTATFAGNNDYTEKTATYEMTVTDSTPYTVTFGDEGSVTQETAGAAVTLPERDDISSYAFVGWSETNVAEETTTAPTIIPAGSYTPTANITLYPVYSKTEGGGGTVDETASVNIASYATGNSWVNGTQYETVTLDENVTATANGSSNTGKYYTTGNEWRFYQGESAYLVIETTSGTLTSATITYKISNGGQLTYEETVVNSGSKIDLSGTSACFWVENSSSATNGQVKITGIEVNYSIAGGGNTYYWSTPVAPVVERPVIVVAQNSFMFSTTATITCDTEGATIKYSFDGETWNNYTEALTITETKTIYAKAIKDETESSVASVTATKNLAEPTVAINATGITNTNVFTGTDAGSLAATVTYNEEAIEGATVTWSGNNDEVATIDAFTGAVTLVAAGNVSFTATYAGNDDFAEKSSVPYVMTVTNVDPNAPGTENNPYTVAQARAAIDAGEGITNVYATGIVSQAGTVNGSGQISYYISADGLTTSDQLQAYRGKGIAGANFENDDDIQVGDVVVIYGTLKKYNAIYEFDQNNQLIRLERKSESDLALTSSAEVALEITSENINPTSTIEWNTSSTGAMTFTSSNELVATVTNAGIITAVGAGEATITFSQAADKDYKASTEQAVAVTITDSRSACATGLDLTSAKIINLGEDGVLAATSTNAEGFTGEITYSFTSGNEDIFLINGEGYLGKGVGAATVTITATPTGGNAANYKPAMQVVDVQVNSTNSISLDLTSKTQAYNAGIFNITATVPTANYDGAVSAESSNPNVATVSVEGTTITVTPQAVGTATITVTAGEGTYYPSTAQADCDVTLTAPEGSETAPNPEVTYTFDFTNNTGWDLPTDYTKGENTYTKDGKTITLNTPDNSNGYKFNTNVLLIGKSGATLTLPAFDKPVTKITTTGVSSASGKVMQNIYVGETAVSTESTSAKDDHEYVIAPEYQAPGTIYTFKVTNGNNTQLSDLTVHMYQAPTTTVTLNKYGYATFCSENPVDFTTTEGYTAWRVNEVAADGTITFKKVTEIIKGGQGVLLYNINADGENTSEATITFADGSTVFDNGSDGNDENDNLFLGTTAPTYVTTVDGDYTNFGLSGEKFVKINDGVVKAGKAYLPVPTSIVESLAGARLTFVFEDETTGIRSIENGEWGIDNYFDLQGRKIAKPAKGLYIKNGKKVVVK